MEIDPDASRNLTLSLADWTAWKGQGNPVGTMAITTTLDKSKFAKFYLLLAALGLSIAGMMGYSFYTTTHIINVYTPLVHAAEEIQKSVTTSHLWLEEMLSGDGKVNLDGIRDEISKAEQYIHAMLFGARIEGQKVARVDNDQMREAVILVQERLAMIRDLTEQRAANYKTSGAGTLIDERYDAVFEAFMYQSVEVEDRLNEFIDLGMKGFRISQVSLIVSCLILMGLVGLIIYTFERKQQDSINSLFHANRQLQLERNHLDEVAAELARHRDHLESIVDERTTEVKKALLAAQESNAAKSEFLSSMSHELRTPLNAILGFGQVLDSKNDDHYTDNDRICVKEILNGGKHLLELVNDVLDLSSIEAGHLEISTQNYRLNEVLNECIAMIKPLADKRGICLQSDFNHRAGELVNVDYRRIKQVILNLLSNAVKYNRENGSITLKSQMLANGRVRIIVEDVGLGISEEHKVMMFEPFMRATSKTNVSGTGIGLVITKRLIEAMGGEIGYESLLGRGSKFWIDILRADEAAA